MNDITLKECPVETARYGALAVLSRNCPNRKPSLEAELRECLRDYVNCIKEYQAAFLIRDAGRMDAVVELRHDLEIKARMLLAKGGV
jgi:hypothetical protein